MCSGGRIIINENDGRQLSLNNGDCIESVKMFCCLGDMLNAAGGVESTSLMRVRCAGRSSEIYWTSHRQNSIIKTER